MALASDNTSFTFSAPAGARPELARVGSTYLAKYLGVDMILKFFCYYLRLRLAWATDTDYRNWLNTLILSIVDARMLCNSMKHFGTAKAAWSAYATAPHAISVTQRAMTALSVMSLGFRVGEQIFGDLGYLQKNWMSQWDRHYLSNNYKFYKCLSLLCCALLEMFKLRHSMRRAARRFLARCRHCVEAVSPVTQRSTHVADDGIDPDDPTVETCSVVTSPLTLSPAFPFPSADQLSAQAPEPPQENLRDWLVKTTREPHVRSILFVTRNVADLIVYSQWIEWYHPWKTLEALCGMYSGACGAFIVWVDADNDLRSPPNNTTAQLGQKAKSE